MYTVANLSLPGQRKERWTEMKARERRGRMGPVTFDRPMSSLFSALSSPWPCSVTSAIFCDLFQQGSFSFLIPNIPASLPLFSFLFQGYVYGSAYASPSLFSLHAVSLYPWQPMISFSPELGARPQARRGCVCVWFWHGCQRERVGGEECRGSIRFDLHFHIWIKKRSTLRGELQTLSNARVLTSTVCHILAYLTLLSSCRETLQMCMSCWKPCVCLCVHVHACVCVCVVGSSKDTDPIP